MSDQDVNSTNAFFVGESGSESPVRASILNTHSGFDVQTSSSPQISSEAHKKGKRTK